MSGREFHRAWSWATLVAAFTVALLFFAATESRYCEYASWTRGIRASLEAASLLQEDDSTLLNAVIVVQSPRVGFVSTVERVEFTLDRGGKHLGYFFTLPGEMAVDSLTDGDALTRISVRKDASSQLASIVAATQGARPAEGEDGPRTVVRFAGDVVLEIALRRGGRLLRIPVEGEVKVDGGA
ncbi:MAG: hypothetical protein ACM3X4_11100 [Ignavibacteriales bacterium]